LALAHLFGIVGAMNVLITAGGTRERIDAVRGITNTSTGALGSLIADGFAGAAATDALFYLAGPRAKLPRTPKAKIVPVGDTASLEAELRGLLARHKIDVIVHAMAVSDFRVTKVTSASRLQKVPSKVPGSILEALDRAEGFLRDEKIASNLGGDKLVLVLEETPKIIGILRVLAPQAVLVGFKLLDGVSEERLIETGYALLKANSCDFVLANDARTIQGDRHTGFFIDAERNIFRQDTKAAIAGEIVRKVTQKAMKRMGL
jgi:phosphopantothenate-cysteine ligase